MVPIILRPVDWMNMPFSKLQALPTGGKPVTKWPDRDDAFLDIAKGIRIVVERLRNETASLSKTVPYTQPPEKAPRVEQTERLTTDSDKENEPPRIPEQIGRYRVETLLGEGAFGRVYLAHDDALGRRVAIKTPHPHRITSPEDIESYLREARILASLDHPRVVPVYDVGQTENSCYVVSKLIEGSDLARKLKKGRPSFADTARLVAGVAEGLHHAHERDLFHRDIKPANILLDKDENPYVTDFGLALKEDDFGKGGRRVGTPAYMSPEQARGEGHRVEGRSDIFSLGVVLYEMIAGRRPFRGKTATDLLERIAHDDARPPRQIADNIPAELERICLKALANRITDRYTNAKDLADDLHYFVETLTREGVDSTRSSSSETPPRMTEAGAQSSTPTAPVDVGSGTASDAAITEIPSTVIDQSPRTIVPKGLRSFDHDDTDFFLQLLPGPRDRHGLPDSIRFWKRLLERREGEQSYPVLLLYGPSGCGKTSLVQAGLLPRLSDAIVVASVEASQYDTERRLRRALDHACPKLQVGQELSMQLAAIRRGEGLASDKKLVIVIDQFEQWLHKRNEAHDRDFINAIRQCNGARLQCLLMVRVDFMMGIHRFMREVEVPILEGRNSAAVDLFDQIHARKVLAQFGRAFDRLPGNPNAMTSDQMAFLNEAVADLAEDGKVIAVQIALLAHMIRGKEWRLDTLRKLGGLTGLGVTFLDETFGEPTSPLQYRVHQAAARSVLQSLVPDDGASSVRDRVKTYDQLLAASGYQQREDEFQALLNVLDADLRLITPTEPEGSILEESHPTGQESTRYYQLAYDYMVKPLREWLMSKEKESMAGRARLRLKERSALWHSNPKASRLPVLWEFLNILLFTSRRDWSSQQRRMLRSSLRYHALRISAVASLCIIAAGLVFVARAQFVATSLVNRLINAEISRVPAIIADIQAHRPWTEKPLRRQRESSDLMESERLRLSLAFVETAQISNSSDIQFLSNRLLIERVDEFSVIRAVLHDNRHKVDEAEWNNLEQNLWAEISPVSGSSRSLRASGALALFAPTSNQWNDQTLQSAASQLTSVAPSYLDDWKDVFRPIAPKLVPPLVQLFMDRGLVVVQREFAADVLADYAGDEPDVLIELVKNADVDPRLFELVFAALEKHSENVVGPLERMLDASAAGEWNGDDSEGRSIQLTNLAAALLRLGKSDNVWHCMKSGTGPSLRSHLIVFLNRLRVSPQIMVDRVLIEQDTSVRQALLLALSQYPREQIAAIASPLDVSQLMSWYKNDPDPGVHAAAERLLHILGKEQEMMAARNRLIEDEDRLRSRMATDPRRWYVNTQGQTFVLIPEAQAEPFSMGSPLSEPGREQVSADGVDAERQHTRLVGRQFAISAHEVTISQYKKSLDNPESEYEYDKKTAPSEDCPASSITWYQAAKYCNWLSKKEGISKKQWCYADVDDFSDGMSIPSDYLDRTGYRLPTEAEWEFACRAGSLTSRFYGESPDLLRHYAWYAENSKEVGTHPVGGFLPNDFGLFDMYGNVLEWCFERPTDYPTKLATLVFPKSDEEDSKLVIENEDLRVARGAGFTYLASNVRSAMRERIRPHHRYPQVGFRVARTWPHEAEADAE